MCELVKEYVLILSKNELDLVVLDCDTERSTLDYVLFYWFWVGFIWLKFGDCK